VPVVVVTSDDQPLTRQSALEGGALELIVKPATFEAIEAALKAAKLIP
jgi:DNA-binding NarL/FixJ family response regulator